MHSQESGPTSQGGQTRPPSFFPWRLQWGLSVFQWGSNPHNPPANFYPAETARVTYRQAFRVAVYRCTRLAEN